MAPTKRNLSYERHVCVCCWLDEQCVTLRCWRVCLHDVGWWCVIFCFRASPTAVVANRTGGFCLQSSLAGEVSKFPPLARARLCPLAPPSGFDWIRVCERHRGRFLLDYLYPSGVRRVWQGGTNIFCVQGAVRKVEVFRDTITSRGAKQQERWGSKAYMCGCRFRYLSPNECTKCFYIFSKS